MTKHQLTDMQKEVLQSIIQFTLESYLSTSMVEEVTADIFDNIKTNYSLLMQLEMIRQGQMGGVTHAE